MKGPTANETSSTQGPLVLIIEDHFTLLELEKCIFERAGYRVCGFGSGEEALAAPSELLREARIALVDAVFGGLETIQALRKINPRIKTAIVTGRGFDPHPDIDMIVFLPFRHEELLHWVRELLS